VTVFALIGAVVIILGIIAPVSERFFGRRD
jgi:hypothetical protein